MPGRTLDEKLRLNHVVDPETGCWRWSRARTAGGYGHLRIARANVYVHRIAYELWIGPIGDGMTIDHVYARGCRYRDCMNPAHLEAVTHAENMARTATVFLPGATHCGRGHDLAAELVVKPSGQKVCNGCRRDQRRSARLAVAS